MSALYHADHHKKGMGGTITTHNYSSRRRARPASRDTGSRAKPVATERGRAGRGARGHSLGEGLAQVYHHGGLLPAAAQALVERHRDLPSLPFPSPQRRRDGAFLTAASARWGLPHTQRGSMGPSSPPARQAVHGACPHTRRSAALPAPRRRPPPALRLVKEVGSPPGVVVVRDTARHSLSSGPAAGRASTREKGWMRPPEAQRARRRDGGDRRGGCWVWGRAPSCEEAQPGDFSYPSKMAATPWRREVVKRKT